MDKWNKFLASLSTRGGAIFLTSLICLVGVCVALHLIHHGEASGPVASGLITTFNGFAGALLIVLKGTSDSPDKNPTAPPSSTQELPKV